MKFLQEQFSFSLLFLFSILLYSSITGFSLEKMFVSSILCVLYGFQTWIFYKRSITFTKEDDFADLHKKIRKSQLEKQLFQVNQDIVKLNQQAGEINERKGSKIVF